MCLELYSQAISVQFPHLRAQWLSNGDFLTGLQYRAYTWT